jgi:hypothetical protein
VFNVFPLAKFARPAAVRELQSDVQRLIGPLTIVAKNHEFDIASFEITFVAPFKALRGVAFDKGLNCVISKVPRPVI